MNLKWELVMSSSQTVEIWGNMLYTAEVFKNVIIYPPCYTDCLYQENRGLDVHGCRYASSFR